MLPSTRVLWSITERAATESRCQSQAMSQLPADAGFDELLLIVVVEERVILVRSITEWCA